MMVFKGHINQWFEVSEPDYYLFFLKAWIPFNAWYVSELPHLNKKDTDIIKELQDNSESKPRKIIENYILSETFEANQFRSYLCELHYYLELKATFHNGSRLSFKNLHLTENAHTSDKFVDEKENVYKVEKTATFFHAFIQAKSGKTILNYKKPVFDMHGLKMSTDFIRLNDIIIQNNIEKLYALIDPNKPTSIISDSLNPAEFILLGYRYPVKLRNNPETIAKCCIKVLYALRCMLFHGEIEPNNSNKPIYENAYNLLRLIIKDLR